MTGLTSLWHDLVIFLQAIRWDRPACLWLGLVPIVMVILEWISARRDRHRVRAIGAVIMIESQIVDRPRRMAGMRFLNSLVWMSLAIALAGPRWGPGESDGVAVGRDLAIVLDLSRSMLADDTERGLTRWQAAVNSAIDLAETLKNRGGHRVSITLFAARAKTIAPLTTDIDHIRTKLAEINGRYPMAELRPDREDSPSGTRIGHGLREAIESFDPRFLNSRDVILFSDGDDPANDREYREGISAARQANVPIHCVGVGEASRSSLIPLGNAGVLEFAEANGVPDVVRTRLNEDILQSIARETRGQYRPLAPRGIDWQLFLRDVIDSNESRELSEWQLPQKRSQAWRFYLAAVVVFALMMLGTRPERTRKS
jgi:Ca-activated chloride channel homolog